MSGVQRNIEIYEQFGSDYVTQSGSCIVSFLDGEWHGTCKHMQQPHPDEDKHCRHILKEINKKLIEELTEKDRIITELTEGGRRHAPHGSGCNYTVKNPNKDHLAILCFLRDYSDGRPKSWIKYRFGKDYGINIDSDALSGRLSECCGHHQGWASMNKGVEPRVIYEEDENGCIQFRCNGKRLYYITEKGRAALNR